MLNNFSYLYCLQLLVVHVMNELVVGAFLFLTGYTHFLHYWNSGTFNWKRVLKVSEPVAGVGWSGVGVEWFVVQSTSNEPCTKFILLCYISKSHMNYYSYTLYPHACPL